MRIAYQYLHDAADADEAVQDAFLKAFSHIDSYREAWPFEVWFTRILINGCLDRRKARLRRDRWFVPTDSSQVVDEARPALGGRVGARSRGPAARPRTSGAAGVGHRSARRPPADDIHAVATTATARPREVSAMTGLKESTVRVHLFRAARKLRALLGGKS